MHSSLLRTLSFKAFVGRFKNGPCPKFTLDAATVGKRIPSSLVEPLEEFTIRLVPDMVGSTRRSAGFKRGSSMNSESARMKSFRRAMNTREPRSTSAAF